MLLQLLTGCALFIVVRISFSFMGKSCRLSLSRCLPPSRGPPFAMQHSNGFTTPLRSNGFVTGPVDDKHSTNLHDVDGTTPMLTQPQESDNIEHKTEASELNFLYHATSVRVVSGLVFWKRSFVYILRSDFASTQNDFPN